MSCSELKQIALGAELMFVRTEHVRAPKDGSLSRVGGVIVAFGDDRRAFLLSPNSFGDGVAITEWDPEPVDMGEYGVTVTKELLVPDLEGAFVSDLVSSKDGDQGSLAVCLDNGGRIVVMVAGDEVELEIVQPA